MTSHPIFDVSQSSDATSSAASYAASSDSASTSAHWTRVTTNFGIAREYAAQHPDEHQLDLFGEATA